MRKRWAPFFAIVSSSLSPDQASAAEKFADLAGAEEQQAQRGRDDETPSQQEVGVVIAGNLPSRVVGEPELPTSVISGEALDEPGVDAARVLARSPGVQVQRTGGTGELATVSIRGASAAQIPVYLAGVRLNGDLVGVADLSRLPLWMIERISVYRGTTPLHSSRSGLSGALVFDPSLPVRSQVRAGAMVGSYSHGAVWVGGTHAYGQPEEQPSSGRPSSMTGATNLSIRRQGTMNDYSYQDDGGTAFEGDDDHELRRKNADSSSNDVWLTSQLRIPAKLGAVRLTLLGNLSTIEQGAGGLALLPTELSRVSRTREILGLKVTLPCRLGGTNCRLWMSTNGVVAKLTTDDPAQELALNTERIDQSSARAAHQLRFQVEASEQLSVGLSAAYEYSSLKQDSPEATLIRAQESFFGAIGSVGYSPHEIFFVRGAGRASCVGNRGVAVQSVTVSRRTEEWTGCLPEGRLGATLFAEKELSFRASLARGVRFPTLGERFGINATMRGNPELEVERAWSADVGASYASTNTGPIQVTGEVSIFARSAEDLVAYQRSALGYVRPYNVKKARFLGTELSGQVEAWRHVRATTQISVLDPRDTSLGGEGADLIPYRSPFTWSQEVEIYDDQPRELVTQWGVTGYLNYRSARTADPAGLVVIPEQFVFDLALRVQLKQRLDLRFRAENLLDSNRFDTLGYPLSGRAFFMSVELTN